MGGILALLAVPGHEVRYHLIFRRTHLYALRFCTDEVKGWIFRVRAATSEKNKT